MHDVVPIEDDHGWICGICGVTLPPIDHPTRARKADPPDYYWIPTRN